MTFFSKTLAERTAAGARQSVEEQGRVLKKTAARRQTPLSPNPIPSFAPIGKFRSTNVHRVSARVSC